MRFLKKLPDADVLRHEYGLNEMQNKERLTKIEEIKGVLRGDSKKKIIIVGPCSSDKTDSVIDYASRLSKIQEKTKRKFVIIMRAYTSKPRSSGFGYKGMIHNQLNPNKSDELYEGIITMRKLHFGIVNETGMFSADEILYPEVYDYISDLTVYMTVGARSVENQGHRLFSSGVEQPVGMKNPTSGNIDVLINSVRAAQHPQRYFYNGWEVEAEGNQYTHAILRGYINRDGKMMPNYNKTVLKRLMKGFINCKVKNPSIIVDCNHANSSKDFLKQIAIAKNVFDSCSRSIFINESVKGIMIESYIVDGAQSADGREYGKSITDACLGFEKTKALLLELADSMPG